MSIITNIVSASQFQGESASITGSLSVKSLQSSSQRVVTVCSESFMAEKEMTELPTVELSTILSTYTGSLSANDLTVATNIIVTGSVTASSFNGSLQGTSSWAMNAVTSSHANISVSSSYALSASYADTEEQVQSDWNQADTEEVDYIKNKPVIPSQYTDEMAQDAIGGILTDSDEIDFTYDDSIPEISATIKPGSIDETKLDVSVNASLDKADGSLQIDQTTPQTITNGIPLLESIRVIDQEHEIIDKQFISDIFINTGIRYYFTNTNSDVTGFLIASTVKPVLAEEDKLISFIGIVSDVLIGQWVLDNDTSEKTFNKGIYSFSIYSQINGMPDPDDKVKIFFEIWEIDSDGNDIGKILESSKSDFIPFSKSEIIISGILDSEYTTTVGNYVCIKIYGDSSGDSCKIYFYYLGTTNTGLTIPINKDVLDSLYNPLLNYTPENVANKKTDLTDNSDTYYPTQKAVNTGLGAKQDTLGYTPTQKLTATVTIAVADWSGGLTCTKAVTGLLATDTVLPVMDRTNFDLYSTAYITADSSSVAGQITFTAETIPTSEIVIPIEIIR